MSVCWCAQAKDLNAAHSAILSDLMTRPENRICADCDVKGSAPLPAQSHSHDTSLLVCRRDVWWCDVGLKPSLTQLNSVRYLGCGCVQDRAGRRGTSGSSCASHALGSTATCEPQPFPPSSSSSSCSASIAHTLSHSFARFLFSLSLSDRLTHPAAAKSHPINRSGVHISKVRSTNLDTWRPEWIKVSPVVQCAVGCRLYYTSVFWLGSGWPLHFTCALI